MTDVNRSIIHSQKDTIRPKTASVLDLGSNSLKIANYKISHDTYKPYHQESIRLKLLDGIDKGVIKDDHVNRIVESLKLFRNIVDFENVSYVVAVATSAIRDSKNQFEIVQRIHRETGFDFMILSEHSEAIFSYAGAAKALGIPSMLFFDIGGGSLELVLARNYEIKSVMSLPLGALRLTRKFANDEFSINQMTEYVKNIIPSRTDLGILESEKLVMVGVGGTMRALARYDQSLREYRLSKVHNYKINYNSLKYICSRITHIPTEKIGNINAIGKGRADIILAGNIVILELMKRLGFKSITVSAHGLREGALAVSTRYHKKFVDQSITYSDIQSITNNNITNIGESTRRFVDVMYNMNLLTDNERDMLLYALTEIDNLWSFRDVENVLHSIMDDDSHLSHKDQITVALSLIYSKKRNKVEPLLLRFENILESNDERLIKKMASVISICEIFHRTYARVDTNMQMLTQQTGASNIQDSIIISIHPKTDVFPEMLLNQACHKLENVFKVSLETSIFYPQSTSL